MKAPLHVRLLDDPIAVANEMTSDHSVRRQESRVTIQTNLSAGEERRLRSAVPDSASYTAAVACQAVQVRGLRRWVGRTCHPLQSSLLARRRSSTVQLPRARLVVRQRRAIDLGHFRGKAPLSKQPTGRPVNSRTRIAAICLRQSLDQSVTLRDVDLNYRISGGSRSRLTSFRHESVGTRADSQPTARFGSTEVPPALGLVRPPAHGARRIAGCRLIDCASR